MIRDLLGVPASGLALLYHDIVSQGEADTSGFVTEGSWRYKLSPQSFADQLSVVTESAFEPTLVTDDPLDRPIYLTFDDGGRTAMEAARRLEANGYRGHFFIVVDRVGERGFLNWDQIHDLNQRGHCIGSHTMTHTNLLKTDPQTRQQELTESKAEIVRELGRCQCLSIPLGAYDEAVFEAAREAGYRYVFTSEPIRIPRGHQGRRYGRWNIWYDTGPEDVAAILEASPPVVIRTAVRWYGIKFVKRLLGYDRFVAIRDKIT